MGYSKRTKILSISYELLARFLRDGTGMVEIVKNRLPDDARVFYARDSSYTSDTLELFVESASYPEVPDGELPPHAEPPVFAREAESDAARRSQVQVALTRSVKNALTDMLAHARSCRDAADATTQQSQVRAVNCLADGDLGNIPRDPNLTADHPNGDGIANELARTVESRPVVADPEPESWRDRPGQL